MNGETPLFPTPDPEIALNAATQAAHSHVGIPAIETGFVEQPGEGRHRIDPLEAMLNTDRDLSGLDWGTVRVSGKDPVTGERTTTEIQRTER